MTIDKHNEPASPAFIERWEQVFYNVKHAYLELAKGRGASFEQDIWEPVVSLDNSEVDDPIEIVRQFLPPSDRSMARDKIDGSWWSPVMVATAYCHRAREAVVRGDHDLGWVYLVDAGYLCGSARAGNGIADAMQIAVDTIQQQGVAVFSQVGNKAQKAESEALIAEAYRLVREKKPADGLWPTIGDAASAIKPDVLAFAAKRKIKKASDGYMELRLRRALGKMPDAAELFSTKASVA